MAKRRPKRTRAARRSRAELPSIEELFQPYQALLTSEEWGLMCEAFKRPLPSTLWGHPERLDRQELRQRFEYRLKQRLKR